MNIKHTNRTITMQLLAAIFIGCLTGYHPALAAITPSADKMVKPTSPDDEFEQPSTDKIPASKDTIFTEESLGLMLHENHCANCHASMVYIRAKRKAKNYREVDYWVNQRADWLNLGWTALEKQEVTRYLNQRYYKYPVTQ